MTYHHAFSCVPGDVIHKVLEVEGGIAGGHATWGVLSLAVLQRGEEHKQVVRHRPSVIKLEHLHNNQTKEQNKCVLRNKQSSGQREGACQTCAGRSIPISVPCTESTHVSRESCASCVWSYTNPCWKAATWPVSALGARLCPHTAVGVMCVRLLKRR